MSSSTDLYRRADFRDLFTAVCASPLDDAVRLVLADWLEEQGEIDQATFIRIQIERAALRDQDPRSVVLSYEEAALLNRHRRRWLGMIPEWLRPHAEFERGLPGRAELKASLLLEYAADDWTHVPLHEVSLKDVGSLWAALFDWKGMKRVTSLDLHLAGIGPAGIKKLVASRHLSELRTLRLYENGIGKAEARLLARSKNLPRLTRLRLASNPLGKEGIEALTATDFLSRLTDLDLYKCDVTGPAVRALMDGPIDNLRRLDLSAYRLRMGNEGIRALADCPRLKNLEDLNLQFNVGGDDDLLVLAASPYLTNLRTYCFDFADDAQGGLGALKALGRSPIMANTIVLNPWMGCPSGDDHVCVIAESPSFANVRHLVLTAGEVTRTGLEALAASPYLRKVTQLDLEDNQLGDHVDALAGLPFVGELLELDLDDNDLEENAAHLLADSGLVQLRCLKVSRNPLGNHGIEAICESDALTQLRELWAHDCNIGAKGAQALANSAATSKLQTLYLAANKLGVKGATALAHGGLRELTWLDLCSNKVKAGGVKALTSSKTLTALRKLGLHNNAIGDSGAKHLASWPGLAELSEVLLSDNQITDAGARALIESPHRGELNDVYLGDNPGVTIDLPDPFHK
jgi:uncharacterized protein (TIGR02996 family)